MQAGIGTVVTCAALRRIAAVNELEEIHKDVCFAGVFSSTLKH